MTLNKRDKIPYGTYVSYHNLKELFPSASVFTSRSEPGYWDSVSVEGNNQAFISISDYFNADDFEMRKLMAFAGNGNFVFISAVDISNEASKILMEGMYPDSLM